MSETSDDSDRRKPLDIPTVSNSLFELLQSYLDELTISPEELKGRYLTGGFNKHLTLSVTSGNQLYLVRVEQDFLGPGIQTRRYIAIIPSDAAYIESVMRKIEDGDQSSFQADMEWHRACRDLTSNENLKENYHTDYGKSRSLSYTVSRFYNLGQPPRDEIIRQISDDLRSSLQSSNVSFLSKNIMPSGIKEGVGV